MQWSEAEEAHFLDLINSVLSSHLWSAAKQSGLLVNRGSDGVNKHWKAMVSQAGVRATNDRSVQENEEQKAVNETTSDARLERTGIIC